MSTLKADTIQNTSGGPATFTQQSAARVFIAADGSASLHKSLNVSSGVDEGTGDYKYNLTNALDSTTMENAVTATCLGYQDIVRVKSAEASASVLDVEVINTSAGQHDAGQGIAIHGDLA
jgi:hypothetical protein|tara:strand:+ start:277 stop:636 length:360 start_codon:yes stop_codon:yes gene_type:complete